MKILKRLFACVFSATVFFTQTVNVGACSGEPSRDSSRVWLFQPDLANVAGLRPFLFAGSIYYDGFDIGNTTSNDFSKDSTHYEANIREWREAAGNSASEADVRKILYHLPAHKFFRQLPDTLSSNTFVQTLKRANNKPLMDYLLLSKKIEGALNKTDEWGGVSYDFDEAKALIPETKAMYEKATSPFLKLRTAYQWMRLTQDLRENQRIYSSYIAPIQSNSWIKGSAFYYTVVKSDDATRDLWEMNDWYGTETPKLSTSAASARNVQLAKAFQLAKDKRFRLMQLFDRTQLTASVTAAQSVQDKATLHIMHGLRDPGRTLATMQAVYNLDPTNESLKMLVAREINKIEDWLLTTKLTGDKATFWKDVADLRNANPDYTKKELIEIGKSLYAMRNRINDLAYLKQVATFAKKVITDNKASDKSFWLLSGAYLAIMDKNYTEAQTLLSQAKGLSNLPANVKAQIAITDVLSSLMSEPTVSTATEQKILNTVQVLKQSNVLDINTLRDQFMLFVANKYLEQKDVVKATLFFAKTQRGFEGLFRREDQFASQSPYMVMLNLAKPRDYDRFFALTQKAGKTPFEQFMTSNAVPVGFSRWSYQYDERTNEYIVTSYEPKPNSDAYEYQEVKRRIKAEWDINKLKDYKSMHYIRRDQLDSALVVLQTIPEDFWQKNEPYTHSLDRDPFFVNTASSRHNTGKVVSKTQFVRQILQLKAEAERDPSKRAKNYYQLGNAYYNMTWHGSFWLMNNVYRSIGDMYLDIKSPTLKTVGDPFYSHYLGATRAKKYYLMAMQNSRTDHTLAQLAAFMADYCDQHNQRYQKALLGKTEEFSPVKKTNATQLRTITTNTQMYDELSRDCTGLEDYIERYRLK